MGKVAIVTGGGTGLGETTAFALASEGAKVVLASRTESKLRAVADAIRSQGGIALAVPTDVSNESAIANLVAQTLRAFGQIDILVNNGATTSDGVKVANLKLDDWTRVLATNLTGTMLCCRAVLDTMIARRTGSIINISSAAGKSELPFRSPYVVSKWGVVGLTQTLALEVGRDGVRVNAIAPGPIQGDRIENALRRAAAASGRSYEELVKSIADRTPLKRIVTAAEVAKVALFLASDESSGITGETITVNPTA